MSSRSSQTSPGSVPGGVSRRGLLGGLAATALLTACRAPWPTDEPSAAATSGADGSTTPASETTDVTLLRSMIEEVTAILTLVTDSPEAAVATTMSGRLRPVHTAHLAALEGAEPAPSSAAPPSSTTPSAATSSTTPSVRPKPAAARATILAAENAHLTALTTAAAGAASGGFARLLSSMAAGLAQHLTATAPDHALPKTSTAAPVLSPPAPTAVASASPSGAAEPTGSATATLPAPAVAAIQELLAGEHAALFVLGVLAGRARGTDVEALRLALRRSWIQHRELRDQTESLLRSVGAQPVAAAAEYAMPGPAVTAAEITGVALGVEQRSTAVRAAVVGHAEVGPVRSWAIALTNESAVRELSFGGNPVTFPGAA